MRLLNRFSFLLFLSLSAHADFTNDIPNVLPPAVNVEPKTTQQKKNKEIKEQKKPIFPKASPQFKMDKSNLTDSEFGAHNSNAPVYFSGQYARGSRKTGVLNLVGDATLVQDDTTLKSHKAQIFALPGCAPLSGGSQLKRALATGNVHIFKKTSPNAPQIKATGEQAELLIPERILTLKGKAKIWRGDEYIAAHVIRIDLAKGDYSAVEPEGTVAPNSMNTTPVQKKE